MLRPLTVFLLCMLASGAPLRAGEDPPKSELRTGLEAFFETLREAVRDGDAAVIRSLVDVDGMLGAMEEDGVFEGMDTAQRVGLKFGLRLGILAGGTEDLFEPFETFELRTVEPLGADSVRVYVRHRDAEDYVQKLRWSLRRKGDGWRAYDWEELDLGMSFAMSVGLALRSALDDTADFRWVHRSDDLQEAVAALGAEDADRAIRLLRGAEGLGWPSRFEAVRKVLLASALLFQAEGDEALREVDEALGIHQDLPLAHTLRAAALNLLGRHQEALEATERYEEMLDVDEMVLLHRANALDGLGRRPEALTAYERGLEMSPRDLDLLLGYLLTLPAERKGDVGRFLGPRDDLLPAYQTLAELVLEQMDAASLQGLVDVFRAERPDHPDGDYYQGHVHLLEERHDEAAAAFRAGWPEVTDPDERWIFVDWYLEAMRLAGRAEEAWAETPDPAASFSHLAFDLGAVSDVAALRRLLDSARDAEAQAGARNVAFVQGEVAFLEERWEEAAEALDTVWSSLSEEAPARMESPEGERWTGWDLLWQVEDHLVRALFRQEQFEAVLPIATRIERRDDDPRYLLLAHLARGDVDEALRLARRCREADWDVAYLIDDDEFVPLFAPDALRRVREILEGAR